MNKMKIYSFLYQSKRILCFSLKGLDICSQEAILTALNLRNLDTE